MRKTLAILFVVTMLAGLVGCSSSSDTGADVAPKGAPPNTVEAPPGAKNPEERAAQEQGAQDGAAQDGGAGN